METDPYEVYKATWRDKTSLQITRELDSWRRRIDRHSSAYALHGKDMTPPGTLADGDKVSALKEVLAERVSRQAILDSSDGDRMMVRAECENRFCPHPTLCDDACNDERTITQSGGSHA